MGRHAKLEFGGSVVSATVEVVTPSIADEYLKLNYKGNRAINNTRVAKMSGDISAGKWLPIPHGITFAIGDDGGDVLIDGQHTLTAVASSGKPVELIVWRGFNLSAFYVIDTGRSKSNEVRHGTNRKDEEILSTISFVRAGRHCGQPSLSERDGLASVFLETAVLMREIAPSSRAGVSKATVRAAFVVLAAARPAERDAILEQYRLLTLGQVNGPMWPSILSLFVQMQASGSGHMPHTEAFARTWSAITRRSSKRVTVRAVPGLLAEARGEINALLGGK